MDTSSPLYQHYFKLVKLPHIRREQRRLTGLVKERGHAKVAFIVSTLTMWRCHRLLDLLMEDKRFSPVIVLHPFCMYEPSEQEKSVETMRSFFASQSIPFLDVSKTDSPGRYLRDHFDPDIVFYPQPYFELFGNDLDSRHFDDKLLCYVPYSLNTIAEPWPFNQRFSNVAWRLFYSTEEDRECAREVTFCKGKNVRVVGNALADSFLKEDFRPVWKPQPQAKKRVIWAPHFSIAEGGYLNRNSFLKISEEMVEIAKQYKESIQFAFKPHPRLKSMLYEHQDWGKERTDHYFEWWAESDHTQLETGNYIDLFMTSDAMMHDCASFTAEYLYSRKPVLFLSEEKEKDGQALNRLGLAAFNAHYFGSDISSIKAFLDTTVLGGEDPLKEKRDSFFKEFLLPPGGRSTGEIIYQELKDALGFEG